ncbi:hypothetical protein PoB_004327000 [Plakobranchus ocellatus]|uniref:Uncharacterized protein n=1 Tax=Plakobranchus ocellatus TaxID=259542 RepID=A0AAV4B859_9GAST|nr:hypothetical protein PoB_004327000 [Plakobranchus ocellatus]
MDDLPPLQDSVDVIGKVTLGQFLETEENKHLCYPHLLCKQSHVDLQNFLFTFQQVSCKQDKSFLSWTRFKETKSRRKT